MAAAVQVPEPLNYQTVALKVSIHCEGCKREVKRVLHHIEGVYRVTVDLPQHKVVVTCNVAAETLIKKLNKTGKHAELWPEPKPPEDTAGAGGKKKRNKKKKNKNRNSSDAPPANEPPPQKPEGDKTSSDEEENPSEAPGKPEAAPPGQEKQGGAEPAAANGGGGGGGGAGGVGGRKKKGKKGGHSNGVGGGGGGGNEAEAAAQGEAGGTVSLPAVNSSAGKLPTYVVSYSSVQPGMGHGRAYFHDPSPVQQGSYVYSTASPGSYYIFSEENANACSVM